MKFETEKLLGTLKLLTEPLEDCQEMNIEVFGNYQTFFWDVAELGEFNIWKLLDSKKFIEPTHPETAFKSWLKEEQTHSIAPHNNYSIDQPEPKKLLDETTKAQRTENYQALWQILQESLQILEGFTIRLSTSVYKKQDCFSGLFGKTADNNWIVICPTAPERIGFPYWISHQECNREIIGLDKKLQTKNTPIFQIEDILKELIPLKLAVCYGADYGYTYDYQLFCGVSASKEAALTQAFIKANFLQLKRFKHFRLVLSDDYGYPADFPKKIKRSLNKFFQQNFTDVWLYRVGLYDIDYIYIIGQVADADWLGVKIYRSYQYNP